MSARTRRRSHRLLLVTAFAPALGAFAGGCIIGDRGGAAGAPPPARPPTASVPDSGSFVHRESAAETLNEADPDRGAPGDATLQVDPAAPGRTPPPPVR